MKKMRRNHRFYTKDNSRFFAEVEANPGKTITCFLHDISITGACIIIEREIFLQREKEYPFSLFEQTENGKLEKIASVNGTIAWYLLKEFKNQEMLYLGIKFQNEIALPDSIASQEEISA